jgi:hypothetical protein
MRMPGITASASTATIKPSDGSMNTADPYGMRMPGVSFVNPTAQIASQPAHRTQPIVRAHAPTGTNANPNNG